MSIDDGSAGVFRETPAALVQVDGRAHELALHHDAREQERVGPIHEDEA